MYIWSRRWMEVERDDAADAAQRRLASVGHLDRMRALAQRADASPNAPAGVGASGRIHVVTARYYVAEAERGVAGAGER